jgi:LuxR family transcriptional regulator, maltose regulon positive regulatory protein
MEQAAPRYWLSGDAQTVQSWLAALPDAVLWQHARFALQAMRRLLESFSWTTEANFAHATALLEPTLARLEALLRQHQHAAGLSHPEAPATTPEEHVVVERRLRLLRALIEARSIMWHGDRVRLADLGRELTGFTQEEDLSWQMIALSIDCWLTEGLQRQGAVMLPRLLEVNTRTRQADDLLMNLRL